MAEIEERFDSKKHFISWVEQRAECLNSEKETFEISFEPNCWGVAARLGTTQSKAGNHLIELPHDSHKAAEIWTQIQEDNICLFLTKSDQLHSLLVAVRNQIWQSLDDKYFTWDKHEFVEISDDEAKQLLPKQHAIGTMFSEVAFLGISCRVIWNQND